MAPHSKQLFVVMNKSSNALMRMKWVREIDERGKISNESSEAK